MSDKVTLGKLAVEVRELTMKQIAKLTEAKEENATTTMTALLDATTNATVDELIEMKPSELQALIDKMVELNTPFLSQQRAIGNDQGAEALEQMIRSICLIPFIGLSQQDTE